MTNAVVIAFYIWLAVSVVWLVVAIFRRRQRPEAVVEDVPTPPVAAAAQPGEAITPGEASPPTESSRSAEPAEPPASVGAGAEPRAGEAIGPEVRRDAPDPEPTLADLLVGVRLPCGLVPTPGPAVGDPDRHVALLTDTAPPEEVGPAMADELERLGYAIHALGDDEAVARRDDDLLSLRIHPRAADAPATDRARFAGAPPDAVVIELWVGAAPLG
jgi:hypothetical protein